jgi:hypothetical protein
MTRRCSEAENWVGDVKVWAGFCVCALQSVGRVAWVVSGAGSAGLCRTLGHRGSIGEGVLTAVWT